MSKGKQILVDLTPLLDVILIILFMFVARSQATSAVNNAEQNNKDNETKKEYDTVQRENNSLKALDKACKTITVSIKSEKDSEKRTLIIQHEKDEEEKIDIDSKDTTYAKNKLKTKLNDEFLKLKEEEKIALLIFQYDGNLVYDSDYNFVDEVLKKVQKGNEKIYLSYFDTSEQKNNKQNN